MVGRNSAALIAQIGKMTTPEITEGRSIDIAGAVRAGLEGYDWGNALRKQKELEANKEALATALQAEDEAQIADAWAKADPMGYAQRLDQMKQARLEREQQLEDDELKFQRQLALKKAGLDLEKTYDITPQMKNIRYLMDEGLNFDEAKKLAFNIKDGQTLTPYEKELQKQQAKAEVEQQVSQRGFEQVKDRAKLSIEQGKKALKSGTGLGFFGGRASAVGLSTKKGQQNRSDVETANIQMNLVIRQALKDAGVTARELDAATESAAYRYTVNPTDDERTALRKLDAFEKDFLSEEKPTKAQQMQQGLSQIVPQEEQMSRYDFSKPQNIGRFKVMEVK